VKELEYRINIYENMTKTESNTQLLLMEVIFYKVQFIYTKILIEYILK